MGHISTIRAEAQAAVHAAMPDAPDQVSFEDLPNEVVFKIVSELLPFTKGVVSESLRLHPPVAKDVKIAIRADVLPDGTKVKPGQAMVYSPYAMGRDPTLWPEPLAFKPSRWLKASS